MADRIRHAIWFVEERTPTNGTQGEANGESLGLTYAQTASISYAWLSACALALAVLILEFVYVCRGAIRRAAEVFMGVLKACNVKQKFCRGK